MFWRFVSYPLSESELETSQAKAWSPRLPSKRIWLTLTVISLQIVTFPVGAASVICGFFGLAKERLAGKDWN